MKFVTLIISFVCILISLPISAQSDEKTLQFGTWQENIPSILMKHFQTLQTNLQGVYILPINERKFMLYQNPINFRVYLSHVSEEKEDVLWETAEIEDIKDYWTPTPIVAAGLLDQNMIPDILLSYSVNCGNSQRSKCWHQYLRLFIDSSKEKSYAFDLSSIEKSFREHEQDIYYTNQSGGQAFWHHILVIIFPANKGQSLELLFWTRSEFYFQPKKQIPSSLTYKINRYKVTPTQMSHIVEFEGDYMETSQQIYSLLGNRKEIEKAPEPLFLDFSRQPIETLCNQEQWFHIMDEEE